MFDRLPQSINILATSDFVEHFSLVSILFRALNEEVHCVRLTYVSRSDQTFTNTSFPLCSCKTYPLHPKHQPSTVRIGTSSSSTHICTDKKCITGTHIGNRDSHVNWTLPRPHPHQPKRLRHRPLLQKPPAPASMPSPTSTLISTEGIGDPKWWARRSFSREF